MHILNRFAVVLTLLMALVPLGTLAVVTTDAERIEAQRDLEQVLRLIAESERDRADWQRTRRQSEAVIERTSKELQTLAREKRSVRLRLAELNRMIQGLQSKADSLLNDRERSVRLMHREQERLVEFVRYVHARKLSSLVASSDTAVDALRGMIRGSLGERVDEDRRLSALKRARQNLIVMLLQAKENAALSEERLREAAGDIATEFIELQREHEKLAREYLAALDTLEEAEMIVTLSEDELLEVKREFDEVQTQVRAMQSELERIDARIRRRAERSLIEKGLLGPRTGSHSDGDILDGKSVIWPVIGRISAGFMNEAYKRFFGIPHYGMDIVTPQGSAVRSAAEGVVYVVRDGGQYGYTYVLIGHRDGYATLYGHLSEVSVVAGQDVRRGEVIGLSGGKPGTHGAGRMTTGAHLHFEVIENGVHVDPRTFLP